MSEQYVVWFARLFRWSPQTVRTARLGDLHALMKAEMEAQRGNH